MNNKNDTGKVEDQAESPINGDPQVKEFNSDEGQQISQPKFPDTDRPGPGSP
jgi:hypothetical protein